MKLSLAFLLNEHNISMRNLEHLSQRVSQRITRKLNKDIYFCCGMADICDPVPRRIVLYEVFKLENNNMTLLHKKNTSIPKENDIQKELIRQMEKDSTLHEVLKSTLKLYPFDF